MRGLYRNLGDAKMKTVFTVILFFQLSSSVYADDFKCADPFTGPSVAETLGLEPHEPLWLADKIAVDPLLAPLASSEHGQTVNLVLYPHAATIDWIFQTDVGDLNKYPEYADELEESRVEGMKVVDQIAKFLFDGDVEKAKAHVMAGNASIVQQFEFERRHLHTYVNAAGGASVQREQIVRQSEKAWVVYDVRLKEAVAFAQFFKSRKPAWLDHIQIFALGAIVANCETGQCSIQRPAN
jgi:hypothetical protein